MSGRLALRAGGRAPSAGRVVVPYVATACVWFKASFRSGARPFSDYAPESWLIAHVGFVVFGLTCHGCLMLTRFVSMFKSGSAIIGQYC